MKYRSNGPTPPSSVSNTFVTLGQSFLLIEAELGLKLPLARFLETSNQSYLHAR